MSAITAAAQVNPPLPFTKDAIIDQLRRQATNGPAYVQHSATKALAHLKGLYAEARYEARLAFEATRDALRDAANHAVNRAADQAAEEAAARYARITELANGATPTEEEIALANEHFGITSDEQEDEEGSNQDDDEPP